MVGLRSEASGSIRDRSWCGSRVILGNLKGWLAYCFNAVAPVTIATSTANTPLTNNPPGSGRERPKIAHVRVLKWERPYLAGGLFAPNVSRRGATSFTYCTQSEPLTRHRHGLLRRQFYYKRVGSVGEAGPEERPSKPASNLLGIVDRRRFVRTHAPEVR